jgi:flagellar protein FlaI
MPKKKKATRRGKKLKRPKKVPALEFKSLVGKEKGFLSELLAEAPPKVAEGVEKPKPTPEPVLLPAVVKEIKPPKAGKVLESYGQVEILSVEGEVLPLYKLKMPELTKQEQKLLDVAKEKAIEEIKIDPDRILDPAERKRTFMHEVLRIIERESKGTHLPPGRIKQLGEVAVRDMLGYGPLDPMTADDKLEDIMVTAVGKPVYVYHRKYGMCSTNVVFEDEDSIKYLIDKIARVVGRRIDQQTPLLDARLPDGSRVNATIPPVSLEGPTISIRKFRKDPLTIIDILNYGTLSTDVAAFLWLVVDGFGIKPANILFAGGTGCGKTTTLNAASTFIPARERVISIEDTAELQLPHKHWVRLETRPPNVEGRGEICMDDLVKNALRMRPDRMVVGEVRGPEARTMFTAMNTGHNGALLDASVIRLPDGRHELIGELCNKLFEKYSDRIQSYKDMHYIALEEKDQFGVTSVDGNLKSGIHRVTKIWRRKTRAGEKLIKLYTRSGNEIILTKTHPLFVVKNGEVCRKDAGTLTPSDFVACMLNPPVVKGEQSFPHELLGGISSHLLVPDETGDVNFLGHTYKKIPNNGGKYIHEAEFLVSENANPVRIPKEISSELAYLVGAVCGDGCIYSNDYYTSVTFDDDGYLQEFVECAKIYLPSYDFDRAMRGDNSVRLDIGSKIFSEMLVKVFEIPKGKKSASWVVPNVILRSENQALAHFIAGLFDADASIDKNAPAVILVSKSESAARKISYALARFRIPAVVKKYHNRGFGGGSLYRVIIRGVANLRKFKDAIPMQHTRKLAKLNRILKTQKTYRGTHMDRIPWMGEIIKVLRNSLGMSIAELSREASKRGYLVSESLIRHLEKSRTKEVSRKALAAIAKAFVSRSCQAQNRVLIGNIAKLTLLADSDVYWDRLTKVEEVDLSGEYLYDLTVDEDHNYAANNLIVSNCMGTVHSNSAAETITRLTEAPMAVPEIMIPALDVIVMQQRIYHRQKGQIRRITEVAEVTGLEGGKPQLSRIFKWNPRLDAVEPTGVPSKIKRMIAEFSGMSGNDIQIELEKRAAVLEWMKHQGIRNIFEVGRVVQEYYRDPEGMLKRVRAQKGGKRR